MGRLPFLRAPFKRFFNVFLALLLIFCCWHLLTPAAYGAQLGNRELQLSSDEIGTATTYNLSFNLVSAGTLGSITVEFCSNDALIGDSCTVPTGFDDSAAVVSSESGQTGFTVASASTANELILTRPPAGAGSGPLNYVFTNVTNPTTPGSYFVRLQTYASSDASGSSTDYGGIAFAVTNNLAISATVPPFLEFCAADSIPELNCDSATGDYIDFGELSSAITSHGSSQMLTATNARSGYNITVSGTTLESGNDVINPIANADVSRPGTSQFGFNLRANTSPEGGNNPSGPGTGLPVAEYDQPNYYQFVSGDTVATSPQPDNLREYTASYIVNVPPDQAAGVYVSTITYICLATF